MRAIFGRLEEPAYLLLRVVVGFTFMCHGIQKVLGQLGGHQEAAFTFMWFAGLIELVGGAGILLGLFTRPLAFLASGEMAYAFFVTHMKWDFADLHWIPVLNKGELAAIYCVLFFYICGRGAGPVSLDRALHLER